MTGQRSLLSLAQLIIATIMSKIEFLFWLNVEIKYFAAVFIL